MLPISPTDYCQLPIANYYYQLRNFILDSSSLPNKIPHGITWKTPGWDERTPRCAISEGIPQKKSVFQWEILLPVEFPTSCILAVDIPTALKPGFHGKGWNSCCRGRIRSWVRDFFPCFAAIPDEFPTNGAGFWLWRNSAEGIPRVWLQALWDGGLSPSVLSAKAQCHGSALGMRRGTDGTPGNKSLPSVADVNSSSAP